MGVSKRNNYVVGFTVFVTLIFLAILAVISYVIINEKTIVVPDEVGSIQSAVDEAQEGDIILVKAKEDGTPYNESVTIDKDHIKLIGIGKEKPVLDGAGVATSGITLNDRTGVLVKNFIVQEFFDQGIHLSNSATSNRIVGNMIKDNVNRGIRLNDSVTGNVIKGNSLILNGFRGVDIDNSTSNIFHGNTLNNNGTGIGLENNSDNNMLKANTVNDNENRGIILVNSTSNRISANILNNSNLNEGILLINSSGNLIKGNTVNENGDENTEVGIDLFNSDDNTITGNKVRDNAGDGIFLDANSTGNDVHFNRLFGNGDGGFTTFDINNQNIIPPLNNFKGNECDNSDPNGLCN
ncbi:NosD domain-containing protein [Bacillus spongiae]|uniref:NosD domain-containing protein n=1 Tax=Bacillus spongiae TaxID=2683610 RepID=A0ABU8HH78_9BACI